MRHSALYMLDAAGGPVPVGEEDLDRLRTWAEWFARNEAARQVAFNMTLKGVRVSTVFVGINANPRHDPPMLWETLAQDRDDKVLMTARYASRAEALAGHAKVLQAIEAST
jgi:hypothetical protein